MNEMKRRRTVVGTAAMALLVTAISLIGASTAMAATTVYQNEPGVLPGNVPSLGFEASSTSQYGGAISLAGSARKAVNLRFGLSTWGCSNGTWNGGDCVRVSGDTFPVTFTARIYDVGPGNSPGSLLAQATKTMSIPYRPSANNKMCKGANAGKWYQSTTATCFNGKLLRRTIMFGKQQLPDDVIVSLAYNTTHYGSSPIGEGAACYTEDGGCGYDSLNVALVGDAPTIGGQPNPDDGWLNSSSGGSYCDGGTGGTGTFRFDAGCWTGYQPMLKLNAR
jgi:hypothetical protein